jgi:hypothetical protein
MKPYQFVLVGLLLLLTGFVGGWLSHRAAAVNRIHRVAEMRRADGFAHHFFRMVKADKAQRDTLMPYIEPYATRIDSLHRGFEQERRAIIREMHEELRPMLTEGQRQRLKDFTQRFRHHKKNQQGGKK